MNIPIPRFVVRAARAFEEWANVPMWERGRVELRRVDLMIAFFFFVCVVWYYHTQGLMGAIQGGAMYIAISALALWM